MLLNINPLSIYLFLVAFILIYLSVLLMNRDKSKEKKSDSFLYIIVLFPSLLTLLFFSLNYDYENTKKYKSTSKIDSNRKSTMTKNSEDVEVMNGIDTEMQQDSHQLSCNSIGTGDYIASSALQFSNNWGKNGVTSGKTSNYGRSSYINTIGSVFHTDRQPPHHTPHRLVSDSPQRRRREPPILAR